MRIIPASLILLVSCTCGAPATSSGPTTPSTSSGPSSYEVHEWGLLRAGPGDVLEVGAVGPGVTIVPMVAEKPVLYFHLAGDGPLDLSVARVEAVDGEIREHWPLAAPPAGPADPTQVSWAPLTIRRGTCALTSPATRSDACAGLPPDEACESLSLSRVVSSDADCVETASGPSPLLFYRSTTRGLTVPLAARRNGTDVVVENAGASPLPGRVVVFTSLPGRTTVATAAPPAPGARVTVGAADEGSAAARTAITTTMRELGLTDAEAAAFLAAWDTELFPSETPPVAEEVERMPAPVVTLLYFLPASDAERVSRLSFTPAPTAVRRAMAVWTAVPF